VRHPPTTRYLYLTSLSIRVLELWKTDLKTVNEKAAEALADPAKYPNLFPDLDWAVKVPSCGIYDLCLEGSNT
jgi:hypothetical protein